MIGKLADGSRLRIAPAVRQSSANMRRIFQERDLHRLGETADEVAVGQAVERGGVVDDRPGDGKRTQPVLLAEQVDARS